MIKDTLKETLPYTAGVRDKIITEIETMIIANPNTANGEFVAGCDHTKKEIIKRIKEINLN